MARYFFNIDGLSPDQEGTEIRDRQSLRSEALISAGSMIRDLRPEFWGGREWQMHVLDGTGLELLTLKFSASES